MTNRTRAVELKSTRSMLADDVCILEQKKDTVEDIKVAAYCRVSTEMEIQKQSLDTQMAAFNKVISEHPGWVLAGIYVDKGISGTSVRNREEFKRMIADAREGKVQYILAKSISRFARNTVDALTYVRELKSMGVSVFFEKEKLDTGNAISEFLLSIFAASAQEEIISLSNNMKVGKRMRFAAGIAQWTAIYGYRCAEDGKWVVEPEEAKVIRRIFAEYTSGRSLPEICKGLMEDGIPSSRGKQIWTPTSVSIILHNEKYIGDIRMQKTFISDPIQHIKVNNRDAKIKQYYKTNHHEAIVDRNAYDLAQTIAAMKDFHRGTAQYPYYGFLKCPICGQNMIRCTIPRNNHSFVWTCGGKASEKGDTRQQRTTCPPYFILDTYVDEAYWHALTDIGTAELTTIINEQDHDKALAAQTMLKLKNSAEKKAKAALKKLTPGYGYIAETEYAVEYKDLCDTVQSISFPQWTVMKIEWKCGIATETSIEYRKVTDMPYPTITKEEVERTYMSKKAVRMRTFMVNGVPLIKGCPDRQIAGIMKAREAIQNTVVLEPLSYEPPVPCVYGFRSTSIKEERK